MADLTADIDNFLNEFGTAVMYKNAAAVSSSIRVIWDQNFFAQGQIFGSFVANNASMAAAKSTDVPGADSRCQLIIGAVTYKIVDGKLDGTGWTILTLSLD